MALCVCSCLIISLSHFSILCCGNRKNGGVLDGLVGWNGLELPLGLGLGWLLGWLGHGVLIYPCADVSTLSLVLILSLLLPPFVLFFGSLIWCGLMSA